MRENIPYQKKKKNCKKKTQGKQNIHIPCSGVHSLPCACTGIFGLLLDNRTHKLFGTAMIRKKEKKSSLADSVNTLNSLDDI